MSKAQAVVEKMRAKEKTVVQQSKTKLVAAVELTEKLLNQAKHFVTGNRIIADRIVSFFDPEARLIKKGKLAKGTEFGYKSQIDFINRSIDLMMEDAPHPRIVLPKFACCCLYRHFRHEMYRPRVELQGKV